jgi:hypothetical protein
MGNWTRDLPAGSIISHTEINGKSLWSSDSLKTILFYSPNKMPHFVTTLEARHILNNPVYLNFIFERLIKENIDSLTSTFIDSWSLYTFDFLWTLLSRRRICKIWRFHGGDYEQCRLLGYKNPVRTPQETHCVSATEPSRLMLCKIWGFQGSHYEECRLLGCYAVWFL